MDTVGVECIVENTSVSQVAHTEPLQIQTQ